MHLGLIRQVALRIPARAAAHAYACNEIRRICAQTKRSACSISWHPDAGRKLAVAFAIMQFQDPRQQSTCMDSYIWDVNNPNTPDFELVPTSPLRPGYVKGGSSSGYLEGADLHTTRPACFSRRFPMPNAI